MNTKDNAAAEADDISARITEEDIERARAQVGIPVPERTPRWTPVPSSVSISQYAFSVGDQNPLWHDRDYGAKTRWRDQIAPPCFFSNTGVCATGPFTPELKKLFRGLFSGVGKYQSGTSWEWYKPIYPGDQIFFEKSTCDVQVRESSFGAGLSVVETYRTLYVDRIGDPMAVFEETFVSAERGGSKKSGKNKGIERQTYTDEDIADIDKVYAAEEIRGAKPRYWENVNVGDALTPIAKGPLTVLDIISGHMARGWGAYGPGPLRYGWKTRQRMPNFYTKDPYGVPDVVQRMHWDEDWARRIGLPAPYDYGTMRMNWLQHLITNWMGDDAWLWRMWNQVRAFNFIGDTTIFTGEVKAKSKDGPHCTVDIEIKGANQRGTVTTPGSATVILPSREHGAVRLPRPPEDLWQRGSEMMAELASRQV